MHAPEPTTPVRVAAYAGGRGDEEPRALEVEGRMLAVLAVTLRWHEPRGRGFEVLAEDGGLYELLYSDDASEWLQLGTPRGAAGTHAKVAFLSRPESHAERPRRVEVVETHMAWVFLTDAFAYKMKKPVRTDFLDFATLEARERDCAEEVRLNARLAGDVYLGVVPLALAPDGRFRLGGDGEVVEWLVHMRRLPEDRMLDHEIARGDVQPRELEPLAELLARFYDGLPPEPIAPNVYVARLRADVERERRGLLEASPAVDAERVQAIASHLSSFLDGHAELFAERTRAGRVVEGHGDLRPEHVHLGERPAVIDCLEFDRELRIVDRADDLAFLALECERAGAPDVGRDLLARVGRFGGDAPPREVVELHMARRAFLRAKLAIWHLQDGRPREAERWTRSAADYLTASESHLAAAEAAP